MTHGVALLTDFSKEEKEEAFNRLSLSQQAYIKRKPPQKAEQSICARILLERLIKEKTGKEILEHFEFDENKRPYILGQPDLNISISHSDNLVAAAFSQFFNIGIDVEKIKPVSERLIKAAFCREEQDFLRANDNSAFFKIWTAREALIKTGLYSYAKANKFCFIDKGEITPPYCFELEQYLIDEYILSTIKKKNRTF